LAWFGRLRIEIRHAAHPAQIANEASFGQILAPIGSPQIPHRLKLALFGAFSQRLRCQACCY
jgi:hypothetical protein